MENKNTVKEVYKLEVTKVFEFPSDWSDDEKQLVVTKTFDDLLTDNTVNDSEMIMVTKAIGAITYNDDELECDCEEPCENCECERE